MDEDLAAKGQGASHAEPPAVASASVEAAPLDAPAPTIDDLLDGRRIPGRVKDLPPPVVQDNPGAVRAPPPEAFPHDEIPVPDRWRLAGALGVTKPRWFDPYNQNFLKGDLPIKGTHDWFLAFTGVSDTVIEPRSFPIPVGVQTTERAGSLDVFGKPTSLVLAQTFIAAASLIKGSTAYKPPELEFRVALAFQDNYVDVPERRVLHVEPSKKSHRNDAFVGVQEVFVDYHLRNVSDRYDFDSLRVGIQPFSSDFRGFLFQDNQLGVRLFGNRDNNRFQYNLAAFWRVEKDTNSGLNDLTQTPRDDFVFLGNLYRQDLPFPGITSQVTVVYNRNREAGDIQIDENGFPVRPALLGSLRGRDYDVTYLGYNADGRIGRINLTASAYYAIGEDRDNFLTGRKSDIRAYFVAAEPSIDFSWVRLRLQGLYASGDKDPYDGKETGFDAIFENPQFAGSDTSYWIRQTIPAAGAGRAIGINGRNGVLNSLRSSKEEGQSNFTNPGTILLGGGADFDVTPELRISTNINHIAFANTAVLQALRMEGTIPKSLGWDASVSTIWRPHMTQNIVFRASAAAFEPGKGFNDLFDNSERNKRYYSILLNAILSF
ncbi:MAG: hypothetical protein KKE02_24525 [Alphaproteobacteria bacterium]|nr:hypothetical protein [Alphaproteobacteria bacterium]MBU1516460.1 hypothetical protein [Alphaproteobacteria bacterium]MBU2094217.1 hypothetical protein [Alphaproteobacteria bacterium]MBU2154206.1 hypothetical protein [Alphaproteobacteria bacterium]MBU2307387.1 hypothetical protein [Alphaproteobacteria bacterium]